MPTPEQQRLYTQLSGLLQQFGHRYYGELPKGATSLRMQVEKGVVTVEIYDGLGKLIGTVPNEKTSPLLRAHLQQVFGAAVSPDPDGVICPL